MSDLHRFFNTNFEHLRLRFFAEIVNVVWFLPIFGEELHPGCSAGFSIRLCPIAYYSSQKLSTTGVT